MAATGTTPTITNSGSFNISNAPTITGTLTNNSGGTVKTTNATFTLATTFTNNGTYQSTGSSTQTFNALTIGTTGVMQGGAGESFTVNRNLTNNSTQNTTFDLSAAKLTLAGSGVTHRVAWTGADLGATPAGYQNNFSLGMLVLASGGSLALLDGDSTAGGALYVHRFLLSDGVSQIVSIATSGGLNIYYDPSEATNAYLGNQTYPLSGGGVLAPGPVPEPSVWVALLVGGAALVMSLRRRLLAP